ncbi:MAG: hypothetical protein AABX04_05475 [Nanoarchaeota archaeon]
MTPLKDTFVNLCVKYRWWLLIIGIFTISFFIGVLLIAFSIVGFVNKSKASREEKMFYLPDFFQILLVLKFNILTKNQHHYILKKCPVCQHELKLGDAQYTCKNGGSKLSGVERDENNHVKLSSLQLVIDNPEYGDNPYKDKNLAFYQWYIITEWNQNPQEYLIDNAQKGNLFGLKSELKGEKDIDSFVPSGIELDKDEDIFFSESNVQLMEPRAVRNYGGGSVRVAKGAYVHLGQSKSHDELTKIDNGIFAITEKKIIFIGNQRSSSIKIKEILGITIYSDGIQINSSARQKAQTFILPTPELAGEITKAVLKKYK